MSTDPTKLSFDGGWEYAPAPESTDHIQVDDTYDLFIGGKFVGGCDILTEMYQNGELQKLLEQASHAS